MSRILKLRLLTNCLSHDFKENGNYYVSLITDVNDKMEYKRPFGKSTWKMNVENFIECRLFTSEVLNSDRFL